VGTALAFATFGIGAVIISATIFPAIRLVSWNPERCRSRIQRAMRRVMQLFVWWMKTLGVLSYEVHGRERLEPAGQLVIANHPSLIDVVFLISLIPEVDCIVKRALYRNPFLRWPVSWAQYIPNNGSNEFIAGCARSLRAGRSLVVFPEGTRTVPGRPYTLRRGAAQIALAADCVVRPVRIICDPSTLTKAEPWYRIPYRKPHWRIEVDETYRAADGAGGREGNAPSIAARRLTERFRAGFPPIAPDAAHRTPDPSRAQSV
jgi:1-acyl-sn-glycerol-3-phosphate acyltransferase